MKLKKSEQVHNFLKFINSKILEIASGKKIKLLVQVQNLQRKWFSVNDTLYTKVYLFKNEFSDKKEN